MTRYQASWVVPITSPPIRDGWVEVADRRVTGVGTVAGTGDGSDGADVVDCRGSVILPSLVNAHTHLELSGLRGRVPASETMPVWARQVIAMAPQLGVTEESPEVWAAVDEVRSAGTGLVGDITNTLASVGPLAESRVDAVVFKELLGFNEPDPTGLVAREVETLSKLGGVRLSLAAHAPYSVSPALFRAIEGAVADAPICVHLAESREELQFLQSGRGPWRAVLEERGRWDPAWKPCPGGPVLFLEQVGWITPRTIVVHGVHLSDPELRRLAAAGVTLVTCPRSNRWTGAGPPPVDRFYTSGVRVAVGTDSLASAGNLNLFAELSELRRLAPGVEAAALLESATRTGAEALGRFDRGAIEAGMESSLITVRCPGDIDDVEEYLVNGIEPDDVGWLDG